MRHSCWKNPMILCAAQASFTELPRTSTVSRTTCQLSSICERSAAVDLRPIQARFQVNKNHETGLQGSVLHDRPVLSATATWPRLAADIWRIASYELTRPSPKYYLSIAPKPIDTPARALKYIKVVAPSNFAYFQRTGSMSTLCVPSPSISTPS